MIKDQLVRLTTGPNCGQVGHVVCDEFGAVRVKLRSGRDVLVAEKDLVEGQFVPYGGYSGRNG